MNKPISKEREDNRTNPNEEDEEPNEQTYIRGERRIILHTQIRKMKNQINKPRSEEREGKSYKLIWGR